MNLRQFLKDVKRRIFFKYTVRDLCDSLEIIPEQRQKAVIFSELFFRSLLKQDPETDRVLETYLPDGELYHFRCNYSSEMREIPPEKLWYDYPTQLSRLTHISLRSKLERFSRTDGFIPLILPSRTEAVFLPFFLEPSEEGGLTDLHGNEIPEWSGYIKQLTSSFRVRIEADIEDGPFAGNSLMLPVQIAIWRKEKSENFPQYDILRLLSTGAFNESGVLASVDVIPKLNAARNFFSGYVFCIPEEPLELSGYREVKVLQTQTKSQLRHAIRNLIEERKLAEFSLRYAMKRQQELEKAVHFQQRNHWESVIQRLESLAVFCKRRHRKEYLNQIMLLSAACCHAGITARAIEFNQQAMRYAEENGFQEEQLRLEIENIVQLLDQEKFVVIAEIEKGLEQRLIKFGSDDLLMRFYGTMGQVHSYGYLAGYACLKKETARDYFFKALSFADKIGNESEIAHDMNYCHLWYALFEPESETESECWCDALNQINSGLSGMVQEQNRQRNYLIRQKAFSLYRCYLSRNEIPDYSEQQLQLNDADFWIKAVWNKYIGTLKAAEGKLSEAERLFREAMNLLQPGHDQVLNFIRMTISAQAYYSLKNEEFRNAALDLLKDPALDLKNYHHASDQWVRFLYGKSEIPALSYWY